MYKTPLKSKVDKNKVSFLLSLLVKPEQKIKFAFCKDLIIENSLYNPNNEHYFHSELISEFWSNYNNRRKYLYNTVARHLELDMSIIQDCVDNISESTSINRSSLVFLSNNLSENFIHGAKIVRSQDPEELPKLFYRTNEVTDFRATADFVPDDTYTFLECLRCDCSFKNNYKYFLDTINRSDNVCILTDQVSFIAKFKRQIHINDEYYICYDKEIS